MQPQQLCEQLKGAQWLHLTGKKQCIVDELYYKAPNMSSLLDLHQDCRASKGLTWPPCFPPHAGSSCGAEFAAAPRGTGSAAA